MSAVNPDPPVGANKNFLFTSLSLCVGSPPPLCGIIVTMKLVGAVPPLVVTCILAWLKMRAVPLLQPVLITLPTISLLPVKLYTAATGELSLNEGFIIGSVVNVPER